MPDLIKVAKFGGTSMADAEAMRRCADIVLSDKDKRIIVVSATSGTTNTLSALSKLSEVDEKKVLLRQIRNRHLSIVDNLHSPDDVKPKVEELLSELESLVMAVSELNAIDKDAILSFGERLSSTIFNAILNEKGVDTQFFDVRKVMKTDSHHGSAEPLIKKIREEAEKELLEKIKYQRIVTQGFIGMDNEGNTTTIGRGGSDYSASLLAEAIDADVLEIWTDVAAIYTTDPRLVPDARPITEISFNEAAELSLFGAKVLHPGTLKPVMRKNIKVYVGSSIKPEQPGTWIVKETRESPNIRAITVRNNQILLTAYSLDMLHRHGFLAKLFQILAKHKISVDLVTTSEVNVSLTLDSFVHEGVPNQFSGTLLEELQEIAEVKIEKSIALIALIGNNLNQTSGISGPIFSTINDINIRQISYGASSHNLCFLVNEEDAPKAVKLLHKEFITDRKK